MRTSLKTKQKQERLPDHEVLLLDYAERLRKHLPGRRAVHLQLSKLQPFNLRSHNLRIATEFFTELVRRHEGQQYVLKNKDIVVVLKGATVSRIDDVVLKLRYLFSDDPLVHDEGDSGAEFCVWYDLEKNYRQFLDLAQRLRDDFLHRDDERKKPHRASKPEERELPEPTEPLTPTRLAQIETAITSFDLSSVIRRQMVCIILNDAAPKPVFNEAYFSIDELRYRLMPEVDLMSDRWLFQRLTCTLDRRLLKLLPEIEANINLPTSININISTLLDDAFATFDREMRVRQSKSVILELQPFDVIADMSAFIFARNLARTKGYKICLDGLSSLNLPLLYRDQLGVDLAKVLWDCEEYTSPDDSARKELADSVRSAGATRVVLTHCGDERALEFGRSLGITLYQGRYIDSLLT